MSKKTILGLETGGTYTRAAITDTDGNLLSYIKFKGGGNPNMEPNAKENIYSAIHESIKKANCELSDIIAMTGGMGGYDDESDLKWVQELTEIEGMNCVKQHVNDLVVAQRGAFILKPGIVAVSGTGSLTLGITETGREINNYYNFWWYENTSAKGIAYNSIYKIIAGDTDETDDELVEIAFNHFGVCDLSELIELGIKGFIDDYIQRDKLFGDLAPAVTEAALNGSHLAIKVCTKAAEDIVTSIKLIGACFTSESVLTTLLGSVANSTFIKNRVNQILSQEKTNKKYVLVEPALPPVLGAVIMAMKLKEIDLNNQTLNNLYKSAKTISKII